MPVQFLKKFELYAAYFNWDTSQKLSGVRNCLTEDAVMWAEVFSDSWETFEDFVEDFKAHYWSEEIQCTVRGRVESDRWDRKLHPTMATHFTYYAGLAKSLFPPMSETQMVNSIMKHFPFAVQTGWMSPGGKTVQETLQYLMRQDQMFKRGRNERQSQGEMRMNTQEIRQGESRRTDSDNKRYPENRKRTQEHPPRKWKNVKPDFRDYKFGRDTGSKDKGGGDASTSYNRVPPQYSGNDQERPERGKNN